MASYKFSGHDSFPCRQFWLKKGYDFIMNGGRFSDDDAIVKLGVGKNMVSAIQFWMRSFGLLDENRELTQIAHFLLGEDGRDPFLEDIGTLWLLHYLLVSTGWATVYQLVFNEFRKQRVEFTRGQLINYLIRITDETTRASRRTLRTDVDVLIRTYVRPTGRSRNPENDFLSLLIDLDLMQGVGRPHAEGGTVYRIESKDWAFLPTEIVLFAILRQNQGHSLSLSRLMADPDNVGNVFALHRDGLQRHVETIAHQWPQATFTDDAGIKELQFIQRPDPYEILNGYYDNVKVFALDHDHGAFPLFFAKSVSFRTGTPRFFHFQFSEEPITDNPEGLSDGIVNLVFSSDVNMDDLRTNLSQKHPTTLYGIYRSPSQARQTLREIQKIKYVLGVNQDDRVSVRELQQLKAEVIDQLNRQTLDSLYDSNALTWVWNGRILTVRDSHNLNRVLSDICNAVYTHTPRFHNELVNRHTVSTVVSTARRNFFHALVENWQQPDLGFPPNRFPAAKSIYLTLLKETGIHRPAPDHQNNSTERVLKDYILDEPSDPSFRILWQACQEFLDRAKTTPRNLNQLIEILSRPPFKLKEGFINFWIPTFLFAKREEFALYYDGVYTPMVVVDTLDLIQKEPEKFRIKSFSVEDVGRRF